MALAMGLVRLTPLGLPLPIGMYLIYWLVAIVLLGGAIQLAYLQAVGKATRLYYLEEFSFADNAEQGIQHALDDMAQIVKTLYRLDLLAYQMQGEAEMQFTSDIELSSDQQAVVADLLNSAADETDAKPLATLRHRYDLEPDQQDVLKGMKGDAFVLVPLLWGSRLHGTLCFAGSGRLDPHDMRYMTVLGERLASSMMTDMPMPKVAIPTNGYHEITSAIHNSQGIAEVLDTLLNWLGESAFHQPADDIGAMLFDSESNLVQASAGRGLLSYWNDQKPNTEAKSLLDLDYSEPIRANYIASGIAETPLKPLMAEALGIGHLLSAPLKMKERTFGAIVAVRDASYDGFSEDEESRLVAIAEQVAPSMQNAQVYAREEERIAELDHLAQFKSSLVYNISHELRTSLASIKAATDLLVDGQGIEPSGEYYHRLLQSIARNVARQETLIYNIGDMAAIENKSVRLNAERLDIASVVAATSGILAPLMVQREQTLSVSASPDLPDIIADKQRLSQILLNLLSNAQKYSPDGSEISLSIDSQDKQVVFTVSDSGVGIPPEERERVFDAFYRVQDPNNKELPGSGLGLAIVKALADLHKGSIRIEDGPKGGAKFIVSLPTEGVNESINS